MRRSPAATGAAAGRRAPARCAWTHTAARWRRGSGGTRRQPPALGCRARRQQRAAVAVAVAAASAASRHRLRQDLRAAHSSRACSWMAERGAEAAAVVAGAATQIVGRRAAHPGMRARTAADVRASGCRVELCRWACRLRACARLLVPGNMRPAMPVHKRRATAAPRLPSPSPSPHQAPHPLPLPLYRLFPRHSTPCRASCATWPLRSLRTSLCRHQASLGPTLSDWMMQSSCCLRLSLPLPGAPFCGCVPPLGRSLQDAAEVAWAGSRCQRDACPYA